MRHLPPFFFLVSAMVLLGAAGFPAAAQTTFDVTDDTYVRGGIYADDNFNVWPGGPGDALRVRASLRDSLWRRVYLRFDVTTYTGPLAEATLTIWLDRAVNSHYNPTNMWGDTASFYTAGDGWTETGITWNNAPVPAQYLFTHVFAHRISTDPDTSFTWDVTPYVQAEFAGDGLVTFVIMDTVGTDGTDLRIFSRETFGFGAMLVLSPTTDVDGSSGSLPQRFVLAQNYPNPFNPSTTIRFEVPTAGHVRLVVSDMLGREVRTLVNGYTAPGVHVIGLDAADLPSGIYFYSLTAGGYRETRRMVVLK